MTVKTDQVFVFFFPIPSWSSYKKIMRKREEGRGREEVTDFGSVKRSRGLKITCLLLRCS